MKLTNQSEAVAEAILDIMEMEGGMGASLKEICKETGLHSKIVRGNLGDLVKKGIVDVDPKKVSGAAYDMFYHKDYVA